METTTSILIAVILLVLTFRLYNLISGTTNYWTSRGITSVPCNLPIFGNTLSIFILQDNLTTWSRRIYEKNHDSSMIGFYQMKEPTLLLRDPELIKIVLQTGFNAFQHNQHTMDTDVDPLLGHDIFFVRGQDWRDSRPIFASAFSTKRLKSMTLTIEKVCEKLKNYLSLKMANSDSLEIEAKLLLSRYTAEVATRSIFSIDGNSFDDDYSDTLLSCMKMTLDPSMKKAMINHVLFFLPILNKYVKTSFVPAKADGIFRKIASDVEKLKKLDEIPRNDVQQMMLDYTRDKKISHEHGLSHAFAFLLESFETSSLTASFMLYELAKNPNIQEKLRIEIEEIMTKYKGQLTYDAIQEMNYMEQVIYETLRLFPPAGYLLKVCAEKYRLEGSDGMRLDVEVGTSILISVLGLHMDPKIWQNPEKFDPERFSKFNNANRHKFAYLAFGEGPRACPGMRLAIIQIKAAIATILRNYRIDVSSKMIEPLRIDPKYFLTSAMGGFWIRLETLRSN